MKSIIYKVDIIPQINDLLALYSDAGWTAYTCNPELLLTAYENSLKVISAWDGNQLTGIIRAVGDGCTILYIQDIIVLSSYQRNGIGKQLMQDLLNIYPTIRQKVLMTDNQPETIAFYTSLGFVPTEKHNGIAFTNYTY